MMVSRSSLTLWRSAGLLCGLAALVLAFSAAAADEATGTPVRILITDPQPGQAIQNQIHQASIQGNAIAEGDGPTTFDVIIVLDISGSTKAASGIDVDRDGEVGFDPRTELVVPGSFPEGTLSSDPGDTILAAEVAAADALISNLEPGGRVRVGIVSFSGEMDPFSGRRKRYDQQDAWVEVPLTTDFRAARSRLPAILARGPYGGTNFAAGLRVAIVELAGLQGSHSAPRPDAKKIVLFLTDGLPTFPFGSGSDADAGDKDAALTAARLAHSANITVNTYVLGPTALSNPYAATEVARITRGTFMPVQNPGDIVSFLQGTSFANIQDVIFTNLTTREVSYDVGLSPDGSFSGFVPVREGKNRIRVAALASNGNSGSVEFDLLFETTGFGERELSLELERIRERNKQLMLLIEREQVQRFREHQRKQLELEGAPEE